MLTGYFDEGFVSVAGFIGTAAQWTDFVPMWKKALGQRQRLHMRQLRWKKDSTRRLLARLGPIPAACGLEGARGVVRVSDYYDLVAGTDDEVICTGYVACLIPMLTQLMRGTPKDERVELFFEEQRQYAEMIALTMNFFTWRDHRTYLYTDDGLPRLARWGFVPKGTTIMTDPADYLAFALREAHTSPRSQKAMWCQPIFSSGSGLGMTLTREQTRRIVRRAQQMFAEGRI